MEKGTVTKTKGIRNEIIAEKFSSLCNDINTHVQEEFLILNRHKLKRTTPCKNHNA
jgi:hypothetical protein